MTTRINPSVVGANQNDSSYSTDLTSNTGETVVDTSENEVRLNNRANENAFSAGLTKEKTLRAETANQTKTEKKIPVEVQLRVDPNTKKPVYNALELRDQILRERYGFNDRDIEEFQLRYSKGGDFTGKDGFYIFDSKTPTQWATPQQIKSWDKEGKVYDGKLTIDITESVDARLRDFKQYRSELQFKVGTILSTYQSSLLFGSQSGAQALGRNLAFLSEGQGDLTREVFQQLGDEKVSDKTRAEVGRSFVSALSNEQLTKLGKTPAGMILLTDVGKTVAKDDSLQLPPFQFGTSPGAQTVQNKKQVLVRLANALGPNAMTLKLSAAKDFAQIREKQVVMQLANVRALNDIETANAPTVVTAAQILQIDPSVGSRAERVATDLNKMMFLAGITDKKAQAMFIAQVLHESKGADVFLRENGDANYLTQLYDVTSSRSDRRQAANQNGNTEPGDGLKYYGQGYLQMTWKNNYRNVSLYAGADLVEFSELASNADVALRTTVKVWQGVNARGVNLSTYIKDGTEEEFKRVTIGINGGLTNYEKDRKPLWERTKRILNIE